jgi:F420-dependent oxidoreductase-like protein
MRAPVTLGLHLPDFNLSETEPDQLFERLAAIARTAEESGFSSITVMDHLHQIGGIGPRTNWMLEGNTILAALAARTSRVSLGLLVGGVTYRNPALLAKITTTLDVISGGRAVLGLGAAWNEEEHDAYGIPFPPLRERFERLEDALRIARAMFSASESTVEGRHHSTRAVLNNPQPLRGDIPILIGGSGERKTLRFVAQYADGCNLFGDPGRARHLLGVLDGHCEAAGRDPAEITKTSMMPSIAIGETEQRARAKLDQMRDMGFPEQRIAGTTVGTPDQIRERAQAYRDVGIEGVTLSLPDVHDLEAVALAGEALAPLFAPAQRPA